MQMETRYMNQNRRRQLALLANCNSHMFVSSSSSEGLFKTRTYIARTLSTNSKALFKPFTYLQISSLIHICLKDRHHE
jgi:hypothetical protein